MKYQFTSILKIGKTTVPSFIAAIVLSSLGSSAAYAQQQAYTNKAVNLRAGSITTIGAMCRWVTTVVGFMRVILFMPTRATMFQY